MCLMCRQAGNSRTLVGGMCRYQVSISLFHSMTTLTRVSTSFEDVDSVREVLTGKRSLGDSTKVLTFVAATWQSIWRARSKFIFQNLPMNAISTAHGIRILAMEWTKFCRAR